LLNKSKDPLIIALALFLPYKADTKTTAYPANETVSFPSSNLLECVYSVPLNTGHNWKFSYIVCVYAMPLNRIGPSNRGEITDCGI